MGREQGQSLTEPTFRNILDPKDARSVIASRLLLFVFPISHSQRLRPHFYQNIKAFFLVQEKQRKFKQSEVWLSNITNWLCNIIELARKTNT